MEHDDKEIKQKCASMLRVDQAGEHGAVQIYKGQLAVLRKTPHGKILEEMKVEEEKHLRYFNNLMIQNQVRPTIFQPLWHAGGYALGVVTALMGEKVAHACTIAVEEVIEGHYQDQLDYLSTVPHEASDLAAIIEECQEDEVKHKERAKELGGEEAPFYPLLSGAIKNITRTAIWLSKRW